MRQIVFENRAVSIETAPVPEPGPGEALVRVLAAGICNTDIELFEGYYGFSGVAGHEFVGRVESCPHRPGLVGQRVVADINVGCGACRYCLAGNRRHCQVRTVIGIKGRPGAFADYLAVPVANLEIVPDSVSDAQAVFAEPLAAALEIGQQVHIKARDAVAVLGDGKLGLLCALGLSLYNPRLTLIGRHEDKLAIARAKGVQTLHVPAERAGEILSGLAGSFDLVVEATGRQDGLPQALGLVRPEGVLVAKTTTRHPAELGLAKLVVDEISLVGSRCGDMRLALDTISSGRVDVAPLIQAVYPFSEFEAAFAAARGPGALKVLLTYPG